MPQKSPRPRLIVGVSGASGVIYGIRLLERLRGLNIESHLVVSRAAEMTLAHETDLKAKDLAALADVTYPVGNIGAAIASGSFRTMGMIVAPCSIKTLSEIASGVTTTLLSRAADVVLKERHKLVLLVRETPLHAGHLQSMLRVTEMGAVVMPPVPAFYTRPHSVDDIVDQTVARALDQFGIDVPGTKRWGETEPKAKPRKG